MIKQLQANSQYNQYDADGDGIITDEEMAQAERIMQFEKEKIMFENEDKKQDAQRNMAWFALGGMLLYPTLVVFAVLINLDSAAKILGDMAATYFVSVAAIVAAFYGKEAFLNKNNPTTSTTTKPLPPPAPRPAPLPAATAPAVPKGDANATL